MTISCAHTKASRQSNPTWRQLPAICPRAPVQPLGAAHQNSVGGKLYCTSLRLYNFTIYNGANANGARHARRAIVQL